MFPCSNQISVLKVVLYQVHTKTFEFIWLFGKAIHCFSFSMFPKITLLCSNPIQKHVSKSPTANSFQNMLCPRKILCLSPTKSYIYSTTTLTEENYSLMCTTKKRETYIYTYQSAHINKSKSQKCVNIQPKIWNSK